MYAQNDDNGDLLYMLRELMGIIRCEGKKLMDAQPCEAVVGNMVKRSKLPLFATASIMGFTFDKH